MKTKTEIGNRRWCRFNRMADAVTILFLFLPIAAWSGGVVTNCTEAVLRTAMAGGGTVTFACNGTIILASTITNGVNTTIDASGRQITLSGGDAVPVFFVGTNSTLTLVNLSVADGSGSSGAGVLNHGELLLQGCSFADNTAVGAPGIDGTRVVMPTPGSNACGGAIFNAGTLKAYSCTFRGNTASGGGGGDGMPGDIFPGPGGGTGREGGGGKGGAIFNVGLAAVNDSTFVDNRVTGGIGGDGGLGGPGVSGGSAGGNGGPGGDGNGSALFNEGGNFYMANCTVISNVCSGGNGGAGGPGGEAATGAGGSGGAGGPGGSGFGAIWAGTLCGLTNCTVTCNLALPGNGGSGGYGGTGEVSGSPGPAGLSGSAGGGIRSGGCGMANTLVAANTPGGNCIGVIGDAGHNLSSDGSCAFTNVGSLNSTDPKLGPLANHGGPTLTLSLLPGSPAIEGGAKMVAPATDQRGLPRPFGAAPDIGAYEYTTRLQIGRSGGSGIDLVVHEGMVGQPCRLLTGATLSDWQCVATNQIGPEGTTLFQDSYSPGDSRRFFKVVSP